MTTGYPDISKLAVQLRSPQQISQREAIIYEVIGSFWCSLLPGILGVWYSNWIIFWTKRKYARYRDLYPEIEQLKEKVNEKL